jgi:hypothetical protein
MSSAYFEKLNQEQGLAVEHGVGIAKERHILPKPRATAGSQSERKNV